MTRYSERQRDWTFMGAVKQLRCLLEDQGDCEGQVEADHAGARPLGHKAPDDTCIPLCSGHHRQRTDYAGFFAGFTASLMRVWCDHAIDRTRKLVEGLRLACF